MTFFVGLAGPGQVGKSTTMRAVHHHLTHTGRSAEQRSFATPLYQMMSAMTGFSVEQLRATKDILWTTETAPIPSLVGWSPRKLLKHYGQFTRSSVSELVWVERAIEPTPASMVVFDDARHDTEFNVCQLVIELERDGVVYACDHESSMPPDPEWIDLKVNLTGRTPEEVGRTIVAFILERYAAQPPKTNIAAN